MPARDLHQSIVNINFHTPQKKINTYKHRSRARGDLVEKHDAIRRARGFSLCKPTFVLLSSHRQQLKVDGIQLTTWSALQGFNVYQNQGGGDIYPRGGDILKKVNPYQRRASRRSHRNSRRSSPPPPGNAVSKSTRTRGFSARNVVSNYINVVPTTYIVIPFALTNVELTRLKHREELQRSPKCSLCSFFGDVYFFACVYISTPLKGVKRVIRGGG